MFTSLGGLELELLFEESGNCKKKVYFRKFCNKRCQTKESGNNLVLTLDTYSIIYDDLLAYLMILKRLFLFIFSNISHYFYVVKLSSTYYFIIDFLSGKYILQVKIPIPTLLLSHILVIKIVFF